MWLRSVRPTRLALHRTVRFSRRGYNGQPYGQHTTYFQQPPEPARPPRRVLRSILLGTTCLGLGAYAHSWLYGAPFFGLEIDDEETMPEDMSDKLLMAMMTAASDSEARQVPKMDLQRATDALGMRANYSISAKAVGHACQLPSNLPCEDADMTGVYNIQGDPSKDWAIWSIFDGHAGPRTAQALKETLTFIVGDQLASADCFDRPYTPNDQHIIQTIKKAFTYVDNMLMQKALETVQSGGKDLAETIEILAPAVAGSCALTSLFDPQRSILRVASTGDSRAVLGRWDDEAGKYVAQPMSTDQTGFNPSEVERLAQDHPGEDTVNATDGRVHGIAVSRAFGDSRWKWPQEISKLVHDQFWGPKPRPEGLIKTPPYLTAEPEVTETEIQTGQHPDFLIMASDGLWDQMSSEDAVTCVQQWLDKYKPTNFLEKRQEIKSIADLFRQKDAEQQKSASFTNMADMTDDDDDTYFDETEKCMKWRVSPKHFVVEDEHCGVHLSMSCNDFFCVDRHANYVAVKNALGGKRRNLFCGVMSIQPPYSRDVRDDITVHVLFFGVDTQPEITN